MSTAPNGTRPGGQAASAHLGSGHLVRLVMRREFTARVRSKVFVIMTILLVAAIAAFGLIMNAVHGSTSTQTVGLTKQSASLAPELKATGTSLGQSIATRVFGDDAAGNAKVRSGDVDALLTGSPATFHVVVKKELGATLSSTLNTLARSQTLNQQIEKAGGNAAAVTKAVNATHLSVDKLQPNNSVQAQRIVLGIIAGILVYLSVQIYGQTVAQGVVEEKTSRVVELLLATVKPWQLLLGKVVGIGAAGFIQILAVAVVGVAVGAGTGVLSLPSSIAIGAVVWAIVWYLLGFLMYALLFAAAGALVSRQEDIGGVSTPLLMLVIIPYVIGITVLPSNPESGLAHGLSIIPLFSPMLMPMRIAMGTAPVWEMGLTVLLSLLLLVVLLALTARIYRNSVLRTGARVKLADALRPA